jgi:hypothetical protein
MTLTKKEITKKKMDYNKQYIKYIMINHKIGKELNHDISLSIRVTCNSKTDTILIYTNLRYCSNLICFSTKTIINEKIRTKQKKYIEILNQFILKHNRPPTFTELIKNPNLPSPNSLTTAFNVVSINDIYKEHFNNSYPLEKIEKGIMILSNNEKIPVFYTNCKYLSQITLLKTHTIGQCIRNNKIIAGYSISTYAKNAKGNKTYEFKKIENINKKEVK